MTAAEVAEQLSEENIPLADIRTILSGVFSFPFDRLGIDGDKDIATKEEYKLVLAKLKGGVPPVYLAGYDIIRGLKIYLSEDVLIPRTETISFLYGDIQGNYDFSNKKVLDLCTGSGIIALSVKKLFPASIVTASDISDKALALAKKSAEENSLFIVFKKSNFLEDIQDRFDVILSNPPYIEERSKDVIAPYEPPLALYSGKDGMDSYRAIFSLLDSRLLKKGIAFFELEASNADKVKDLFLSFYPEGYDCSFILDMENKKRYLVAKKR